MGYQKFYGLAFGAYFAIAVAVFGPFLANPFLMDDEIQVLGNTQIQDLQNWPSFFSSSTMDSGGAKNALGGVYYKPLMTSYYAVAWHFFGARPVAFRIPLLALHFGNAWLLFLFLAALFPPHLAFAGGLLFLVHPINSEVVTYIADVQDVLFLLWGLLALVCSQRIRRPWLLAITLIPILSLALLSKETGTLFLFLVPFYLFLLRPSLAKGAALCTFTVGAAYGGLRIALGFTHFENPVLHIANATGLERLLTAPGELAHYIEVFFFPYRVSTVTDYVVHAISLSDFWAPLLVVFVALGGLAWLWRDLALRPERKKIFYFAGGILASWWALHGNILVPLDGSFADRWFYLAFTACVMMLFLALEPRIKPDSRWGMMAFALITLALSARTMVRLHDWANPIELYRREAEFHPWDAVMVNNVGVELFRGGKVADSQAYFDRASDLNPRWDVAWNNRGAVEEHFGRNTNALALFEKAISLGSYALAYENYAYLLMGLGQREACREFLQSKALPMFPHNPRLSSLALTLAVQPVW